MRRSALLIVLAMLTVGSLTIAGSEAEAHPSDCHAQQTCPSDDHSYVWFDSAGGGWDCALTTAGGAAGEGTIITWEGASYACLAAPGTTTTPGETVTTPTTPPETAPPPPPPPPRPPPPPPERPRASSIQSPSSASSQAPIRTFLGVVSAKLTKGGYVFPVYGPSSFSDTYGAPRATTSWHHGIDIFAPLGAPILAVADGIVFSVGWNDVGGNRLWLRDRYNNHFYYAHLSGFTPLAVDGARVKAGTVLGFVGNTGDAVGTPPHLHFEIHPAARLHLGYDGSINPYQYLLAWQRLQDVRLSPEDARFAAAAGWASPFGSATAPRPGAVLLQLSDISTASGLERGSLQRAFAAPATLDRTVGPLWESTGDESQARGRERGGTADVFWSDVAQTLAWDLLAQCESGGDWGANTGNGYFGGLQFHPGTWVRYGGLDFAPYADQATRLEQITVAERVLAVEGWEAWPACSKKIGLR